MNGIELIANLDKLHTTDLGSVRIKKKAQVEEIVFSQLVYG